MSSAAIRPGLTHGPYPERTVPRLGWADRTAAALWRRVGGAGRARADVLEGFVRSVHRHAGELRGAPDAGLRARAAELRQRLLRQGLRDELVAPAFALVREAASRGLGLVPYDVQLQGGWAMVHGMLAEMETGEGKTLATTLTACTAALAGIPVHVISANDYLVERDAETMGPIYQALGLRVGAVTERERDPAVRRAAYACDVTYGTSKVVAFDYLRDGLERGSRRGRLALRAAGMRGEQALEQRWLLRGLCFAIVDEADHVLIDEARTPLLLSRSGAGGEPRLYRRALRLARSLELERDFRIGSRDDTIEITDPGRERLEELAERLDGFWTGPRRREEWVTRALHALHLLQRDRHYLVRDGKVQIIDQPTGRVAPDRSWERGLHQLVEVKEGCRPTPENETIARISYQQFFRRYLRLAGTTGTAREVTRELRAVYGLDTVVIPTRRPVRRRSLGRRVFASDEAKWEAVIQRLQELHRAGRPVLVGTSSVEASDQLSRRLAEHGLPHQVLNARQDRQEAEIVAEAGRAGRITVATHMAGRGTDIGLGPGVDARGGLHVIATQRAPARRIDRQLFGRCGRQGDPGSYEAILSLEDEPTRRLFSPRVIRWLAGLARPGAPLPRRLGDLLTWIPQRAEELRDARTRRRLVDLEERLDDLLAFAGPGE